MLESIDSMGRENHPGVLRLDADGKLSRGDAPVVLPPLECKALRLLLEHSGRVVSHAQLRLAIGEDAQADTESLAKLIASLQERIDPYAIIEAVYKRGYRLVEAQPAPVAAGEQTKLPRLAILPLATGYSVPEYLGYAVAEQAATQLAGARHAPASMVAQHSIFTLARRGLTALELGALLEADLVLTGSIRALPACYRLEARMMQVSDGSQLWSADLLVGKDRIAGLERELADVVAFRLQQGAVSIFAEVEKEEPDDDPVLGPVRREAWENYQQAHQEWQTLERHHMQDAQRRLALAVELDPRLHAARVDLAHLCVAQSILGYMPPANAAAMMKQAAKLGAAPVSDAMLPMLGWVHFHMDRDQAAALRCFSHSAHLPGDSGVALCRSTFALSRGRTDEALDTLHAAIRNDPWSPWPNGLLIWALHLGGKGELALAQAMDATARFPDHLPTQLYAAVAAAHIGETALAEKLAKGASDKSPYSDLAASVHAYTLACCGREAEARSLLERLHWLSQERYVLTSHLAAAYTALGEVDAAVQLLQAADRSRCPWFFQMLADPRLKPLGEHPAFQAMERILPGMETAAHERETAP